VPLISPDPNDLDKRTVPYYRQAGQNWDAQYRRFHHDWDVQHCY
jgi:hypothetical protein